jgi:hypothetical protein
MTLHGDKVYEVATRLHAIFGAHAIGRFFGCNNGIRWRIGHHMNDLDVFLDVIRKRQYDGVFHPFLSLPKIGLFMKGKAGGLSDGAVERHEKTRRSGFLFSG